MPEPIKDTLKKTGKNMSKENFPISSSTEQTLGDPNCPHCGGLGYLRAEHPVGHPDFGKLTICTCRGEEISKQYVLTARAKGLGERTIMFKHVFRNAIIPIITGFPGYFIAAFFTGSLLIETIFSLEGMGLLAYQSVLNRDYPVVLGTLYFFTIIGLIGRLLSDLSYVVVDPRISFSRVEF